MSERADRKPKTIKIPPADAGRERRQELIIYSVNSFILQQQLPSAQLSPTQITARSTSIPNSLFFMSRCSCWRRAPRCVRIESGHIIRRSNNNKDDDHAYADR